MAAHAKAAEGGGGQLDLDLLTPPSPDSPLKKSKAQGLFLCISGTDAAAAAVFAGRARKNGSIKEGPSKEGWTVAEAVASYAKACLAAAAAAHPEVAFGAAAAGAGKSKGKAREQEQAQGNGVILATPGLLLDTIMSQHRGASAVRDRVSAWVHGLPKYCLRAVGPLSWHLPGQPKNKVGGKRSAIEVKSAPAAQMPKFDDLGPEQSDLVDRETKRTRT